MPQHKKRYISMLALILSGEAIFFLPFVLIRVFRPTVLEVFELSNFQLGIVFSVYGIIAMISYFFGGPIADKIQSRKLITFALVLTAAGGLVMATYPPIAKMKFLYAFWGMTTILLFWAALIKATRAWGTKDTQGLAFGFLEGGRGLFAALMATFAVGLFASLSPVDFELITLEEKRAAFSKVIIAVSVFVFLVAIFAWFALPTNTIKLKDKFENRSFGIIKKVVKMPALWLQAIIIVCGYVAYKATDDFSLFAKEVLLYNDVEAASVGAMALWMRPIAALGAGIIADRLSASKMIIISFTIMIFGGMAIGLGLFSYSLVWLYIFTIAIFSTGIFALRGLYFAIMEEGHIPLAYTGTAVGVISVIGYTPDIFMGPLMGYILDSHPGLIGHQNLFLTITGFSVIGLIAAIAFIKINARTTGLSIQKK